ncbi:hypothetical protein HYX01_02235 [Candidatus Woesearchaeota archaeon]|nr:hypothetical protein [Candidatus Woesearchaeota archaeon]
MKDAKAFAPGNISCIFVIKKTKKPEKSGSLGLGFTVNKGVFVSVKKMDKSSDKNEVYLNNKKINFPTVNSAIEMLTDEKIKVNIKSELPLGCGFGISGASALAAAYSVNKLLKLKKSRKELALIAHIAEVKNMTGLGDVINQYYGGLLAKYKPSYMFKAERLSIKNKNLKNKKIYCKYFSGIDTKKIISDKSKEKQINNAGLYALKKIRELGISEINLKNLIKISKDFSLKSGLLKNKRVINLINGIESKNGNASMIMLGNSVFSDMPFKGGMELIIQNKGAHLKS